MPPAILGPAFRLASIGPHTTKVQTWVNPAFSSSPGKEPGAGDAALTVQPTGEDLAEVMFPNSRKMMRRMRYQVYAVYGLIVANAMVIGYTDPLYTRTPLIQVIVYSGQVGLMLAILMAFFVLTSQTLFIQLGRYDLYLREFAPIYALFAVELLLYCALRIYSTVLLYRRISHLALWYVPGYTPLWAAQRVVLLVFWVAAAHSATSVFDIRYFDPLHLVGLDRAAANEKRGAVTAPAAGGIKR